VITSTGKHFSAGMELSVFTDGEGVTEERSGDRHVAGESFRRYVGVLQDSFSCLDKARMPVIVAIQGGCIGGAVDIDQRLRYPLRHHRRLLLHPGDQYRHDRRRRHLPAAVQADPRGLGARAGLYWPPPARPKALEIGLVNEVFDSPEALRRPRAGHRPRDRRASRPWPWRARR
jgi:enoyl-CoA hydratase